MHSTGTHRLGAALLALSLSFPGGRENAQAQSPLPSTPAKATSTEREVSRQGKASLSQERIAQLATAAHVGLTVVQESGSGYASGVLVQPSKEMERLLHPDEALVLSVSHNAADWTDHSRVYGTLFTPSAQRSAPATLVRTNYEARVIGRFVNVDEDRGILTTSRTNVDIAYLAIRVPQDQVEVIRERALPMSVTDTSKLRIGTPVYAVGSRNVEPHPSGKGLMVSKPNFRKGIVLDPNSQATNTPLGTQFGKVPDHLILTTVQCEPGDSGGALVSVNETSGALEVVGVCSGGSETSKEKDGWIDFPVQEAGVTQDQINQHGMAGATLRVLPQARSPYRGHFTGVPAGGTLGTALVTRYDELVKELEQVEAIYAKLRQSFLEDGGPQAEIDGLNKLHEGARKRIVAELNEFKPSRE